MLGMLRIWWGHATLRVRLKGQSTVLNSRKQAAKLEGMRPVLVKDLIELQRSSWCWLGLLGAVEI